MFLAKEIKVKEKSTKELKVTRVIYFLWVSEGPNKIREHVHTHTHMHTGIVLKDWERHVKLI